jgi:hypothetical protein
MTKAERFLSLCREGDRLVAASGGLEPARKAQGKGFPGPDDRKLARFYQRFLENCKNRKPSQKLLRAYRRSVEQAVTELQITREIEKSWGTSRKARLVVIKGFVETFARAFDIPHVPRVLGFYKNGGCSEFSPARNTFNFPKVMGRMGRISPGAFRLSRRDTLICLSSIICHEMVHAKQWQVIKSRTLFPEEMPVFKACFDSFFSSRHPFLKLVHHGGRGDYRYMPHERDAYVTQALFLRLMKRPLPVFKGEDKLVTGWYGRG